MRVIIIMRRFIFS